MPFVLTIAGWRRGVVAAVVAATLPAVLVGCSSKGTDQPSPGASLPAADGLLKASAAAMKQVKSARFTLAGKGSIAGVEVDSAEGTVTSDGRAQGTVKILQEGSVVSLELIVINSDIYLKGPTGQFKNLGPNAAGAVFDPSKILNPTEGLARLEGFATDARTVGEENVDGVDAYKITASLDGSQVSQLIPLTAVNSVPGTLWISKTTKQLVQISVVAPQAAGKSAQLTLDLTDFGLQTNITPPA
jgi:lipoprotein LprG